MFESILIRSIDHSIRTFVLITPTRPWHSHYNIYSVEKKFPKLYSPKCLSKTQCPRFWTTEKRNWGQASRKPCWLNSAVRIILEPPIIINFYLGSLDKAQSGLGDDYLEAPASRLALLLKLTINHNDGFQLHEEDRKYMEGWQHCLMSIQSK